MARVRVSSQPMLAVISTGNELVEPGEPILPHQVRRSNAYAIAAALRSHGFQRVADDHILDDLSELRQRLKFHLETHDVLVLSGGVSMGKMDLVPRALEELGVRAVFHKVAQRPGKPMWFGVAGSGAAVFALPGNPVSTIVCLTRYVLPALFSAMGRTAPTAGEDGSGRPGQRGRRRSLSSCPSASRSTTGAAPGPCPSPPTARAISPPWRARTGSWSFLRAPIPTPKVRHPPAPLVIAPAHSAPYLP